MKRISLLLVILACSESDPVSPLEAGLSSPKQSAINLWTRTALVRDR